MSSTTLPVCPKTGSTSPSLTVHLCLHTAPGNRECAPCGQAARARYAGRRPKTFLSVLGPLTLERAYYHCDTCRAGICPRDRALGLEGGSLSPATTRMVGLAAAEGSFAKASGLLWELAGVRIETSAAP